MDKRIPLAIKDENKADPPYEIKGRGIPVVGIRPTTTIIFIIACRVIQQVMPPAKRNLNRSVVAKAILKPRPAKKMKRITTIPPPIRPSSSQRMAKMKSVNCCGR